MSINKIVTLVIWILSIGAFFVPADSTAVTVLQQEPGLCSQRR